MRRREVDEDRHDDRPSGLPRIAAPALSSSNRGAGRGRGQSTRRSKLPIRAAEAHCLGDARRFVRGADGASVRRLEIMEFDAQERVKLAPCDRLAVDPSHDVRVRPRAERRVAGGTLGVPAGHGDEQDRERGPPAPPSRTSRPTRVNASGAASQAMDRSRRSHFPRRACSRLFGHTSIGRAGRPNGRQLRRSARSRGKAAVQPKSALE